MPLEDVVVELRVVVGRLEKDMQDIKKSVRKWGLIGGFIGGLGGIGVHLLGGCMPANSPQPLDVSRYIQDLDNCKQVANAADALNCEVTVITQFCKDFPNLGICSELVGGQDGGE